MRVVPGIGADTLRRWRPGIPVRNSDLLPDDARVAIDRIRRSRVLRCDGVHTHVGSQLLDVGQLAAAVQPVAELGSFEVYDFGGGLGARYTRDDHPPPVAEYAQTMIDTARALIPADAGVIVEPGRSMVAAAGSPSTGSPPSSAGRSPIRRRRRDGRNLEVSLYGQRFEATLVDRVGGGETVSVVGRHCESGDQLIDAVLLDNPRVGDLLAVPVTGAYCYTMSNHYNGARRIPVVFAADGDARPVVRRDTWADLLARDVPPSAQGG